MAIISDLNTALSSFRYLCADSVLKNDGLEAMERLWLPQVHMSQKEFMLQDFLHMKQVLAGSGNPNFCLYFYCNYLNLKNSHVDICTMAAVFECPPLSLQGKKVIQLLCVVTNMKSDTVCLCSSFLYMPL